MRAANLAGDVRALARRIEQNEELDRVTQPATEFINDTLDRTGWRELLSGKKWLGHPLHPALTDLPIGFWTSALVVDFLGGKKAKRAATLLVFSGVASAVPTAMAGAHDFTELDEKNKRVGIVHAVSNSLALVLYLASWFSRVRGRRGRGVYFGVLGAAAATLGGYLGGHLVFGESEEDSPALNVRDSESTTAQGNGRPVVTAPSSI